MLDLPPRTLTPSVARRRLVLDPRAWYGGIAAMTVLYAAAAYHEGGVPFVLGAAVSFLLVPVVPTVLVVLVLRRLDRGKGLLPFMIYMAFWFFALQTHAAGIARG